MSTIRVRFGAILIGQDFKRGEYPVIWRREQGRFSRPVQFIGSHAGAYGGSQVSIDVNEMVVPVSKN